MEGVKGAVTRIAATPDGRLPELPLLHRSLLPLLAAASAAYRLCLSLHRGLYISGILSRRRLPVRVISVGNLTWGGNGKTPMVEFLARYLDQCGIPPLILTRGYAGGDEVKMLQRHLMGTSTRIGVGANRTYTAFSIIIKHGYTASCSPLHKERLPSSLKLEPQPRDTKVGVAILDDGMQHWSLLRDVEIVMINSLMPWGNNHLLPRGPLREPLSALGRADIVVIHNADVASDVQLKSIEMTIEDICATMPVFFSRLVPSHLFSVKDTHSNFTPSMVKAFVVLCISAIGFPDAFVQSVKELGPLHVDRLDFTDHHFFQPNDIELIRKRVRKLATEYNKEIIVVVTEKDYDRDPNILRSIEEIDVWVLCSSLQIMSSRAQGEVGFKMKLKELLVKSVLPA